MTLQGLHDDAILAIIAVLPVRSLVDFSLTCRRIWSLSRSAVEHSKYTTLYGSIDLSGKRVADRLHPIEVIDKIRRDPDIAKYIDVVRYQVMHDDGDATDRKSLSIGQLRAFQACNHLENELDNLTFLSVRDKQKWKEDVRECGRNVCFWVLLSLCTNATTLHLQTCQLVACEEFAWYLNTVVNFLYQSPDTPKPLFPRLKTMHLEYDDTRLGSRRWGPGENFSMLEIPTLKHVEFFFPFPNIDVEDSVEDWVWRPAPGRSCSVEHVTTRGSSRFFSPIGLSTLIGISPRLTSLDYVDWVYAYPMPFMSQRRWETIEEYADALRTHADSLLCERSLNLVVVDTTSIKIRKMVNGQD